MFPLFGCIDVVMNQLAMKRCENSEPNGHISISTDLCLDRLCLSDLYEPRHTGWGVGVCRGWVNRCAVH